MYPKSLLMHILLSLLIYASSVTNLIADQIKPFTTDGCSMFPDGTMNNHEKWMKCCIRHDYAYWKGGTKTERKQADTELKSCVAGLGEDYVAFVMHMGVRLGGQPFFPTWYRWGYGWPYLRGYQEITAAEKIQIKARILELNSLLNQLVESE